MPETNLLLTGQPGSGKTTLIKNVLEDIDYSVGGFFSNEMRRGNQRVGFTLETLDGRRGILAHMDLGTEHRIGKYYVDVASLEKVGVKALEDALKTKQVIAVDEIGKMELLSEQFRTVLQQLLESPKPLIGTIMQGKNEVTDAIKEREDVAVFHVNEETRAYLQNEIFLRLQRLVEPTN
ncbi:MAG: Nucleoside-triphosphatase THEP1 [Candidatus Marinimicrobia bacterium]|nr:Nucleoside-triphosphatase THEP1 [Candidatus Neomarinimicrobiota bacterium]